MAPAPEGWALFDRMVSGFVDVDFDEWNRGVIRASRRASSDGIVQGDANQILAVIGGAECAVAVVSWLFSLKWGESLV